MKKQAFLWRLVFTVISIDFKGQFDRMELTIDFVNTFFLRAYEEPPDGRTIHRYVQPGQSLLIGRPAGKYHELDKENVDWDSFDNTPRQQPKKPDPAKAKETMRDLWGTFTEEQVKKETERCLGCGATVVDQNVCVGCGICSTKCKFDALHLERRYDAHEVPYEKLIVNHMAPTLMKRGAKIAARKAKDITLSRKRRQN